MKAMTTRFCRAAAVLAGLLLACRPSAAQSSYEPYTFTTLAGNAGYGSADGTGRTARFNLPAGVAVDTAGNLYVADSTNATIRKITSNGVVTTLAGQPGVPGTADGMGSAARFYLPTGVAVDTAGNVYVADALNNNIRKITPAGWVTTLAGQWGTIGGSSDGTGTNAAFYTPTGVAVDTAGNVYVADSVNSSIRRISPGGVVTTLAGQPLMPGNADGTGRAARFNHPTGVAVDSAGNVYVADYGNDTIRKISPAGVVTTLAGSGFAGSTDGTGRAAQFNSPAGVAVDQAGNVYVADTSSDTIRKITPAGVVTTLAGEVLVAGSADGVGNAARFNQPDGVAVDTVGRVYVADTLNNTIRKVSSDGAVTSFAGLAGGMGSTDGTGDLARFDAPTGVAVDNTGNLYVADWLNSTIRRITPAGVVTTLAGQAGVTGSADGTGTNALFYGPQGVALDAAGNLYVADSGGDEIRKITSVGVVTTLAGSGTAGSADGTGSGAQFNDPTGVAVDRTGNVYVADFYNQDIRKITPAGAVTTFAGQPGNSGTNDGTGSAAQFEGPTGVAVDSAGDVYVADPGAMTIRKISSASVVTTLAGEPLTVGAVDGIGGAARFNEPAGVAVDGSGNVYVADTYNEMIRKIASAGRVTTLGGSWGTIGSSDGSGTNAAFYRPMAVAVDGAGNLYVADTSNNTIREGFPTSTASGNLMIGACNLLPGGRFRLTVTGGGNGQSYDLLASTNLVDWTSIQQFVDTNPPVMLFDPNASRYPRRFYEIGP
jgi:NHL repeat